jgi:hypothetical protein
MADSVIDFLARMLNPLIRPVARWMSGPKRGSTWHYEAAFVAVALLSVAALTTPPITSAFAGGASLKAFLIIWISAGAVFGSFLHAQVGTYMAEDMSHTEKPLTECYHKLGEYWVYKEVLWFAVFMLSGAYPAIAGNVIFILFPVWRKIYKAERVRRAAASAPLLV